MSSLADIVLNTVPARCTHLFQRAQKGSMATTSNPSKSQAENAIDGMVTDASSVKRHISRPKPLLGAYISLLLFMVIFCLRPEDWIPGLSGVPLAKITAIIALLALIVSLSNIRRRLPPEVLFLALLTGQLFLAAAMSSVWRGGAVKTTLDFAKILIVVIVMNAVVNTSKRLHRLIFIQAASVAAITGITMWKGRLINGRLEGVLGGNYSNPNDLALEIVISLPLCLALLFLARNKVWKIAWALAMTVMSYAVFLTGSRGAFLALVVTAVVCLWEFAIRGRRRYLFLLAALVGIILWQSSGSMLEERFNGTFNSKADIASSYDSAQQRMQLFWRSVEVTREHPLFGVGPGNFQIISGYWRVTHNSFTEMSSEGGVPALILYVLLLWCGFKNVKTVKSLARAHRESKLLARALQASLAGYVVGALFASTAYEYFPYFLVAYTSALVWIVRKYVTHSKELESLSPVATTEKLVYEDAMEAD